MKDMGSAEPKTGLGGGKSEGEGWLELRKMRVKVETISRSDPITNHKPELWFIITSWFWIRCYLFITFCNLSSIEEWAKYGCRNGANGEERFRDLGTKLQK